jgi:glycine betaine catabolism B
MLILKSVNFEHQQFEHHRLEQSYIGQTEWLIGRNATCDLVLVNPEVSRVHGRIVYTNEAYHFVDVGSVSGSLLNGKSLSADEPWQLHAGDLLQLGETFLYVEEMHSLSPTPGQPSYPAFLEAQWTQADLQCRCCRIVNETPDVKTFYFVAEPLLLFTYKPGQFVNLELEIDGKRVMRSYSISSSPTRPYHLSLTIKRVLSPVDRPDLPAGLVSNWLHDNLKVGDRVTLKGGSLGNFTCVPVLPPKLLLISAGSGITPMISMTRWVQDTLADCDVVFLHSARTVEDIVFRSELEAIATQMPNFHLAITLTQQPIGRSWMGLTGRVSESILKMVAPDLLERSIYVCGPGEFMHSLRTLLSRLQFPMQNYQEESFGGKPVAPQPPEPFAQPAFAVAAQQNGTMRYGTQTNGADKSLTQHSKPIPQTSKPVPQSATVHFIQAGCTIATDSTDSILELAEQEGIAIPNACRAGACGACKVHVREGNVKYKTTPSALTAGDQQAGYALACVACAVDQVAIDLKKS